MEDHIPLMAMAIKNLCLNGLENANIVVLVRYTFFLIFVDANESNGFSNFDQKNLDCTFLGTRAKEVNKFL